MSHRKKSRLLYPSQTVLRKYLIWVSWSPRITTVALQMIEEMYLSISKTEIYKIIIIIIMKKKWKLLRENVDSIATTLILSTYFLSSCHYFIHARQLKKFVSVNSKGCFESFCSQHIFFNLDFEFPLLVQCKVHHSISPRIIIQKQKLIMTSEAIDF